VGDLTPLGSKAELSACAGARRLDARIASFDTAAFNGAFGRDLERRRRECQTLGLTQRQHALTVALPRYARKVAGVLAQQPLW
jgi:hypothetical protein